MLISKQAFVHQHRQAAESYLLHHLNNIPPTIDSVQAEAAPAACFRLLRLANLTPLASPLDLLRLACKPDLLAHINPFMAEGPNKAAAAAGGAGLAAAVCAGGQAHWGVWCSWQLLAPR